MDSQVLHVMTISNSIIGVSLLAMPYCFKQCGIILSILILIVSSVLSRLSCHLLLKSAIIARRRTFEVLAFHTFGSLGKFMTEIGIIGFLIGTCIAFFVIMGDLGPTIVAKMTGTQTTETLRTSILMALALFCVLPLGLLRNIDSLSSVCTATIGFYFCLVVKIIAEALPHLFSNDWIERVELWRPSGILQCLPIFSMALSCQTQIFEVYQVVQNASLEKMNNLIKVAVNICSAVYIFVGTFGYIAFCNQTFTGNILMSFSSSFLSDAIKIGFVLSVAFSFPLVIFPCRASLYSLLYKQVYSMHEGNDKYIPENRFKSITFVIILIPLVIGIMIPNIELVLGLMGSTIGIMICVIFPATCFICISTKNTNERVLAQIMLFFGILIMVLGTYANLFTIQDRPTPILEPSNLDKTLPEIPLETKPPNIVAQPESAKEQQMDFANPNLLNDKEFVKNEDLNVAKAVKMELRHEPPQPIEPVEVKVKLPVDEPKDLLKQPEVNDKEAVVVEAHKQEIEDKKIPVLTKEKENILPAKQLEQKAVLTEDEQKNLELLKRLEEQNQQQQKLLEESKQNLLKKIKERQDTEKQTAQETDSKLRLENPPPLPILLAKEKAVKDEETVKLEAEKRERLDAEAREKLDMEKRQKLDAENSKKLDAEKVDVKKREKLDSDTPNKIDAEKHKKLDSEIINKIDLEKLEKSDADTLKKIDFQKSGVEIPIKLDAEQKGGDELPVLKREIREVVSDKTDCDKNGDEIDKTVKVKADLEVDVIKTSRDLKSY